MAAKPLVPSPLPLPFTLTDPDLDNLSNWLQICQIALVETVNKLTLVHPKSTYLETLRREAEACCDLRERIESR